MVFEHLDDRTAPSPGDADLSKILQGARTRKRRNQFVSLGAVGLAVAAVLVGIIVQGSPAPLSTSETVYQFDSAKGPLTVGAPVPTTALLDVDFASPTDGFALAAHHGQAIMATSTDGGVTWSVRNKDLPAAFDQDNGYSGQIEFIGSHGFLWGKPPSQNGSSPLLVTDNSGLSWTTAAIGPDVLDVSAIRSNVWAVTTGCDVTLSPPCPIRVQVSNNWGATWSSTPDGSIASITGPPSGEQPIELARITTDRAYMLITGATANPSTPLSLLYTADGGVDWVTRPVPCDNPFNLGAEMAASSTDDLWLLCDGQASGGEQSKELFRSGNGGLDWTLTSSASGVGTSTAPSNVPNQLPLGGYVAPFSTGHKNLAVASPLTAWLKASNSTLYVTRDGGATWKVVPDLEAADFPGSGQGNITFISATQGWICAYGVGLWHTNDGVTWSHLGS